MEKVIVETYYISDNNDATDTLGGHLTAGSFTYRIYLDIAEGSKLKAIYGNQGHPLKISSTAPFFNNSLRGRSFGYNISPSSLRLNTIALDTWITMGFATSSHFGIEKSEDPDTSIIGGIYNDGGSMDIPSGLLMNNDARAGLPFTEVDGLVSSVITAGNFFSYGIVDLSSGEDTTIFNKQDNNGSLVSHNIRLENYNGISGPTSENKVLIAQLTTTGKLEFELNVELEDINGKTLNYVAVEPAGIDTLLSSNLKYPYECGCTDPDYIEYNRLAACDNGSCLTPVILGCMDPLSCNYNPLANKNVPELCCYNSECALDLDVVCPGIVYGCNDPASYNYNPKANTSSDLDTCCYNAGCMDPRYMEYDSNACFDNGSYCKVLKIEGCMDRSACNYNPFANVSNQELCSFSCSFNSFRSTDSSNITNNPPENVINVFPNPANDYVALEIKSHKEFNLTYCLYDIHGRPLRNESLVATDYYITSIDISNLPIGIYLIMLNVDGEITKRNIIKK